MPHLGRTLLTFDSAGRVARHRDYWDAAEALHAKLPLVEALTRVLRRRLTSNCT